MVIEIKGNTADELFVNAARQLLLQGKKSSPRGQETVELNDVWLILFNPTQSVVNLNARGINLNYLNAELEWYKSGSLNVTDISKASSFWSKLADTNGTVNSNYGFLTLKEKFAGKSQLEWCIDRLSEDHETRQAVINYNQPKHKYVGNKDFPCTLTQSFRVVDSKLDSTVMMRSNDLIYGLTYDLPWFTWLQAEVSKSTHISLGKYQHYAASLHVYKQHFKMLEEIANSKV